MKRRLDKTDKYLLMKFRILRDCLDMLEKDIREHGSAYAACMGGVPIGVLEVAAQIWTKLAALNAIKIRRR